VDSIRDLQKKLNEALCECARLKAENAQLKKLVGLPLEETDSSPKQTLCEPSVPFPSPDSEVTKFSLPKDKIALFRSLFRGREDVYPVRWERKDGLSGYSPACTFEWKRPFCRKPQVKCGECENRKFIPVTDEVVQNHLTGKQTIGVYPLLSDETCWFLAADFDQTTWQEDAGAFLRTCEHMEVPAALERSRSGKGGHVWIFFDNPVRASLARKLGCAILTRTMEERHQIGMDSYDRFFPNQDTLPKGGFGNLIALPFQKGPSEKGNSIFVNKDFVPYPDQWLFLSTLQRLSFEKLDSLVREASRLGKIIGIRMSYTDEKAGRGPGPSSLSPNINPEIVSLSLPQKVRIYQGASVQIEKSGLPSIIINELKGLAAFQNPEFYRAQAMRLPTYNKPRIISCAEDLPEHIQLPRGCLEEVLALFKNQGVPIEINENRLGDIPIEVCFHGTLQAAQEKAAQALLLHDIGVLSAPTAFGKTVIAAWVIAARKVNTLILVHRSQLLDQWRARLSAFLNLAENEIGQIGGGKGHHTGFIDVGILQSLNRKGRIKDLVSDYSQVIVDECHHIPAFSFEQVLKRVRARYILGLTATPIRKDGHHPIITMQCGPIRFREQDKKTIQKEPFEHIVIPRKTNFKIHSLFNKIAIQDIYAAMASDQERNDLIFEDVLSSLEAGRSPLLLTERKDHLDLLTERLKNFAKNVIVFKGGLGKKQRQDLLNRIKDIPDREERLILATGRYIGEGFDDARLDTLFLVMPISWRGTLQQYVGRLHRFHDEKRVVQVYDYVDVHVPMLMRMYDKRRKGYKVIGYRLEEEAGPKK
jgi:hypothetical protein